MLSLNERRKMMAVNWQAGKTEAYKTAHKAACVSGEFDYEILAWDGFCDLRETLIWGLLAVKFPNRSAWEITEKNWQTIYKRLYIYEKVTGCQRIYSNGTHGVRKMYFQPEEIYSFIGFSVNAGNTTDTEFKTFIHKILMKGADAGISDYEEPRHDDPYHYQRLQMDSALIGASK